MMGKLSDLFYFFGSMVCHQLSERTICVNEMPLPVCARDTGIYLGIFVSFVFCLVKGRMKSDKMPEIRISLILALMMIPMMLDGASSYVNIRQTDNVTRLVTGMFFGMPVAIFLMPAANFKVNGMNVSPVVKNPVELLILFVMGLITIVLILTGILPWILISSIFVFSLIFIISRMVYTILKAADWTFFKSLFWSVFFTTFTVFAFMFLTSQYLVRVIRDK